MPNPQIYETHCDVIHKLLFRKEASKVLEESDGNAQMLLGGEKKLRAIKARSWNLSVALTLGVQQIPVPSQHQGPT